MSDADACDKMILAAVDGRYFQVSISKAIITPVTFMDLPFPVRSIQISYSQVLQCGVFVLSNNSVMISFVDTLTSHRTDSSTR